jgi:uncharacterized protein
MQTPTEFDWDDKKAAINMAKHGISFRSAMSVFCDPDVVLVATIRQEDGEARYKAVGRINERIFTVVFVMRGETCRVISARRANRKEERSYGNR